MDRHIYIYIRYRSTDMGKSIGICVYMKKYVIHVPHITTEHVLFLANPPTSKPDAGRRETKLAGALERVSSGDIGVTHRLLSSSFFGLPYRTLNMNPQKELLSGLYG